MCIICVDFTKGSLTIDETYRNLKEMKEVLPDEHYDEVVGLILEKLEEMEDEKTLSEKDETAITQMIDEIDEEGQLDFGWDFDSWSGPSIDDINDDPWYSPNHED